MTVDNATWFVEWQAWHAERERSVRAPYGVASLTGTHWLADVPVAIAGLPGSWAARSGRVVGLGAAAPISLAPGEDALIGALRVAAIGLGEIAVRVYDPDAPARTALEGIDTFAPDAGWVIDARFVPVTPQQSLHTEHVDGSVSQDRVAGTVHFTIGAETVEGVVFAADAGRGQLRFADGTNGRTSKQFRFLPVELPAGEGAVVLDFNRAYLSPCAFADHYLCPLPPAQNRFPFPVEAGETFPRRS